MADYFTEAMKQYSSKLPSYQAGIDPLQSYYTDIMKGGPSMLQAMSPEVDAASQQFQQAMRNVQQGAYARGGGLERNLANLEAGRASTISQLLGKARPWAAGQLGNLLTSQQSLGLNALAAAQRAAQVQQQMNFEKWKGIGGGIMDLLRTPIGSGNKSALGGLLGKLPGLGGGAAAGLGGIAAGAVPAIPLAATGGATAGTAGLGSLASMGFGGGAPAAGGAGLMGTLGALATNPITWGVAGALGGAYAWKKSQAHPQANQWVQGDQNRFDQAMANIDTAGMPGPQADALRKHYMTDYLSRLQEFAKQGGHQKIVADQALNTFKQWYSNHANRLGVQIPGSNIDQYSHYQPLGTVNSFGNNPLESY